MIQNILNTRANTNFGTAYNVIMPKAEIDPNTGFTHLGRPEEQRITSKEERHKLLGLLERLRKGDFKNVADDCMGHHLRSNDGTWLDLYYPNKRFNAPKMTIVLMPEGVGEDGGQALKVVQDWPLGLFSKVAKVIQEIAAKK